MTIDNIAAFMEYFPKMKTPITLSIEESIIFSRENKPFNQKTVNEVFFALEAEDVDIELVEFIPCFSVEVYPNLRTVVYFRADLMINEYHIMTLSEKGKLIDKKAIAGTFFRENELIKSVASIDEDGLIQVVIGSNQGSDKYYDPQSSQTIAYEIVPTGKIILTNT